MNEAFAIAVLTKREAVKAVKADAKSNGVRLSPQDIRARANVYLAEHRAELEEMVREIAFVLAKQYRGRARKLVVVV